LGTCGGRRPTSSSHRVGSFKPDLFAAPLIEGKRPRKWGHIQGLVLAVEALSPSTARADRQVKSRIYMDEDADEYWIVDLDARVFERWR